LASGRLLGRRKRFFADIALDDGRTIVAHCPNTGRLLGCLETGARVVVQGRGSATRTLPWTWVLVRAERSWVAVESAIAVAGVRDAWRGGLLPELGPATWAHAEVPYGMSRRSRIDLVLTDATRAALSDAPAGGGSRGAAPGSDVGVGPIAPPRWVEVKATTMVTGRGAGRVAAFPDAVTARGSKQLEDLIGCVEAGARAAVVFAVMRTDAARLTVADAIDPAYGRMLRSAVDHGVELYAVGATIRVHGGRPSPSSVAIDFTRRLPITL